MPSLKKVCKYLKINDGKTHINFSGQTFALRHSPCALLLSSCDMSVASLRQDLQLFR